MTPLLIPLGILAATISVIVLYCVLLTLRYQPIADTGGSDDA